MVENNSYFANDKLHGTNDMFRHYLKVYSQILRNQYTYGRMNVLLSYTWLLISAFYHAKRFSSPSKQYSIKVLGYFIRFQDHAELINLFEEIFIFEVYRFRNNVLPTCIVDGGSNIGLTILYFKLKYPDTPVKGFEPIPNLFQLLSFNILNNNISGVEVFNVGLSNTAESITMCRNSFKSNLNWSMIYENPESPVTTVQSALLSSFIEEKKTYALKLDVEGSEITIINELITSGKIKYIRELIIELHPIINKECMPSMLNQLNNNGFQYDIVKDLLHESSTELMVYASMQS